MKLKYIIYPLLCMTVVSISSCSVLNQSKNNNISGSQATTTASNKTTKPSSSKPAQAKPTTNAPVNKSENKSEKKSPNKTNAKIATQLSGEWLIINAAGKAIPTSDEMPYITFDGNDGRFYSSNGCNIINGGYSVDAEGAVSFSNVLSTMKYCGDLGYDTDIMTVFSAQTPLKVKIENIGHESYLRFYNAKGSEIMTGRKHNMDFLNGNWQIVSVNGKNLDDEDATLFIDINELKIHGNTGCNYFNGEVFINPDKSNAIDFSKMGVTRMACPKMEQESAIILALEQTAAAINGENGKVMLIDASGKELMTLKSIPVSKE